MIMVSLPSSFLLPASTSLDPASRLRSRSDLDLYVYLLDLIVVLVYLHTVLAVSLSSLIAIIHYSSKEENPIGTCVNPAKSIG
jgi:hypothetical protein